MSQRIIQIAVPRPLHSVYDYKVPVQMPLPQIGARVRVPFGRTTTVGICVATEITSAQQHLKEVLSLLDEDPIIPGPLMDLAHWMNQYYHYPIGEVLATMLPTAARKGAACEIDEPDFWTTAQAQFENVRAPAQQALFQLLRAQGVASGDDIVAAGHKRQTLKNLLGAGIIKRCKAPRLVPGGTPPQPTEPQAKAIETVVTNLEHFNVFLLEGVTGSGKTEVYLRSIDPVIAAGRQVLVLVPEIALTPQTFARFESRFNAVGMLHSNLSDHGRLQTWLQCAHGELDILIGTRSAVFTPFRNLGLIIVDEEHDASYKQQEGLRYSARDLAIKRAQEHQIPILLGSATPSLESLYNVNRARYKKLVLPFRAGNADMPSYHLIDMRGQQHTDGISIPLERVIRTHLQAQGQILIFLNRRGYAPTLLCASCGWQAQCSDCDAKLTLHQTPRQLVCHHCALRFEVPRQCEGCGQTSLLPVGLGTQRTEQGLSELFPDVPIYRIDRDTTRSNKRLQAHFDKVNTGDPCIMVGTQMLAKGHHFPNVTLVAVLNADAGFLSPDFRAPERTAQLIVQVAGRAGRAERPGQVWIQSYQPENPNLARLIDQGYPGFAEAELATRASAGMPPAKPMAMLRAESTDASAAYNLLLEFKQQLHGVELLGPVPAPLARVANRTRYQLMLLAGSRSALHQALNRLDRPKLPHTLRWSIDVDPYDSL